MRAQNPSTLSPSWYAILLSIVPGLALIALKSGMLRILGGLFILPSFYFLPILCLAVVLVSLFRARRFKVWSYLALGIVLTTSLVMLMGTISVAISAIGESFHWSDTTSGFILSALVWGTLLILAIKMRLGLAASRTVWVLFALVIGVQMVQYTIDVSSLSGGLAANLPFVIASPAGLFLGLSLLPVLIAYPLARKDGILAALVILAAEYWSYDLIADPGYALGIWTQDATLVWLVNYLPAIGFLILSPLWILMARSFRSQAIGFLFPSSLLLLIAELLAGSVHPDYTFARWLARGLGVSEYVLIIALAITLYRAIEEGKPRPEFQLHPAPEAT